MSDAPAPAVNALINGLTSFLGSPVSDTAKMVIWNCNGFEVAVQRDSGPHVWLSSRWKPAGQVFAPLNRNLERYEAGRPRHSGLEKTQSLGRASSARCLKNVGSSVGAVLSCVRACAVHAGVATAPEVVVVPQHPRAEPSHPTV